jgi:hypothetical protein
MTRTYGSGLGATSGREPEERQYFPEETRPKACGMYSSSAQPRLWRLVMRTRRSLGDLAGKRVLVRVDFTVPLGHGVSVVLAHGRLPQLHVAETEKYAHVTYFNGGDEEPCAPCRGRR